MNAQLQEFNEENATRFPILMGATRSIFCHRRIFAHSVSSRMRGVTNTSLIVETII
jgi:hypothetical protein